MGGRGSGSRLPKDPLQSEFGKRGKPKTVDEALAQMNPHYHEGEEWQINCQRCVYAYEMARRGYDVEAMPRIMKGLDGIAMEWRDIMEGQTWQKMPSRGTADKLIETMHGFGDGARAVVYVAWQGRRGAHVFMAEYSKENGVAFMDPQTGKHVDINHYLSMAIKGWTEVSRVDNLKPTDLIYGCASRRKK